MTHQHENATLRIEIEKLREENERMKAELATTEQELGKHHFAFLSELKKLEQENAALNARHRSLVNKFLAFMARPDMFDREILEQGLKAALEG